MGELGPVGVASAGPRKEQEMTAELATHIIEVCGRHYAAVTGTKPLRQWG